MNRRHQEENITRPCLLALNALHEGWLSVQIALIRNVGAGLQPGIFGGRSGPCPERSRSPIPTPVGMNFSSSDPPQETGGCFTCRSLSEYVAAAF